MNSPKFSPGSVIRLNSPELSPGLVIYDDSPEFLPGLVIRVNSVKQSGDTWPSCKAPHNITTSKESAYT